jgi:osmotically inducible protein OsmC
MQRKGSAVWKGSLKDGQGTVSTASGVLKDTKYSFSTRFENEPGTNPEELIGAAHAGCFSMAFSAQLGAMNLKPESISTEATVTLEKVGDGFGITKIHLNVKANVPGADAAKVREAAENAKAGCPVSKLFKGNADISMDLSV